MKLTQKQAAEYIAQAHQQVTDHPSIRFGQALTALLPFDTWILIHGTEKDFSYWTDIDNILISFYENCVDFDVDK